MPAPSLPPASGAPPGPRDPCSGPRPAPRVFGFAEALPVNNQEASNNHLAYTESLELLVEDDLARRRELLFQRLLKQAQLPKVKTLDGFGWDFNHKLPKAIAPPVDLTADLTKAAATGTGKELIGCMSRFNRIILKDHGGALASRSALGLPLVALAGHTYTMNPLPDQLVQTGTVTAPFSAVT